LFYNAVIERDQKSPSKFEGVILRSKIGVVYIRYCSFIRRRCATVWCSTPTGFFHTC